MQASGTSNTFLVNLGTSSVSFERHLFLFGHRSRDLSLWWFLGASDLRHCRNEDGFCNPLSLISMREQGMTLKRLVPCLAFIERALKWIPFPISYSEFCLAGQALGISVVTVVCLQSLAPPKAWRPMETSGGSTFVSLVDTLSYPLYKTEATAMGSCFSPIRPCSSRRLSLAF